MRRRSLLTSTEMISMGTKHFRMSRCDVLKDCMLIFKVKYIIKSTLPGGDSAVIQFTQNLLNCHHRDFRTLLPQKEFKNSLGSHSPFPFHSLSPSLGTVCLWAGLFCVSGNWGCATVDISGWLLTLGVMLLRLIHVSQGVGSSLLLKNCYSKSVKMVRAVSFYYGDAQNITITIILYIPVQATVSCYPADPQLAPDRATISSVDRAQPCCLFSKTPHATPTPEQDSTNGRLRTAKGKGLLCQALRVVVANEEQEEEGGKSLALRI